MESPTIPTTPPILDKYGPIAAARDAAASAPNENMFLQLLITQLRNQDPLSPMENAEFIQQVATFASLEESQSLNAKISDLVTIQQVVAGQNAFTQSANLVGKYVEYTDPETGEPATGRVNSVHVTEEGLTLDIDGVSVPLAAVSGLLNDAPADSDDPTDPDAGDGGDGAAEDND